VSCLLITYINSLLGLFKDAFLTAHVRPLSHDLNEIFRLETLVLWSGFFFDIGVT
jgi:hypothetical protein